MIFYLNRQRIAVRKVSGSVLDDESPLYIGSGASGVNTCGGNLSRIRFFGSALRQQQIADYYGELPVVAWKLTEGEGDLIIDQGSGFVGRLHGAVWEATSGIAFSSALSFNQPGARVIADEKGMFSLGNRFTVAAWMQRNGQMEEPGMILCRGNIGKKGHFRLQAEPQSGLLTFYAPDLGGKISTGIAVRDTLWHHIMISYGGGVMRFYLDRQLVKTAAVKGSIRAGETLLSIGALPDGQNVAGAMLAEAMIYNSVRLPEEVTSIVPPVGPRLNLKKGIVFDRIQNTTFPVKKEWQISDNDIEVARSMGFDHIKILLTADKYIEGAGLNTDHMYYVDQIVNTALASGLPCVVTLHPEPQFKQRYLGTDTGFVQMLQFYRDFARYLADRWGPDKIAFTLMTEPWGNRPDTDWGKWSYMWPKMYSVVRKEMPDHTLILSGDRAGNIYAMTEMVPVDDTNVYYSFTTYEPYRFGFSTMFGGWRGQFDFWKDVSYIPWPSSPEIVSARMDSILINVKPEHKTEARKAIQDYGEAGFNRVWWMMRVRGVKEWNDAFGGNLHVLVAEFGALDHMKSRSNGASNGVYPHERINYIRDMRESFESVGMGWEYWSFNEYFTVFDPEVREPYGVVNQHMIDNDLLRALGLQH